LPIASMPDVPFRAAVGWRRPSFWGVVLKSVGDAASPIQSALTSVATPVLVVSGNVI